MINLSVLFRYAEIENLGFYTGYAQLPVPDIIDFNWQNILSAPPSNTSKQTISELETISNLTNHRSNNDIQLIKIVDSDPDSPFIDLIEKYNLKYPMTKINEFYHIIEPILMNIKGTWNRPRPSQLAKFYNIDIDFIDSNTTRTASYPSGHTVYGSLVANILKYYYPNIDQRQLDILVNNTARARILQGVHYPSDNKASIVLTKFLFNKLKDKVL